MPRTPITHHAIERWQLRVDRRASGTEARLAIGQVLALAVGVPALAIGWSTTLPLPEPRSSTGAGVPGSA
jgi:hypothetical protein